MNGRYTPPAPNPDVPWDRLPEVVRGVFIDAVSKLAGTVRRGKVHESYSVYRCTLYVRNAEGEPTHGVQVTTNYDGKSPRYAPVVRFDGKWLRG